ncbi:unnamed protein product, partial [Staurois parvus]
KLIGLHESNSFYKWRKIYWDFFFLLVMPAISAGLWNCTGHSDTGGELTWCH